MRPRTMLAAFAAPAVVFGVAAAPAAAKCTRLAFSVNDYGKDGPIRDAKALLDKYIAEWTGQRGIKKYTVGKKDVSCELFLDFIVFDEHTCKAEANVCWTGGDPVPPTASSPATAATRTAAPSQKKAAPLATGAVPAKPAAAKAP